MQTSFAARATALTLATLATAALLMSLDFVAATQYAEALLAHDGAAAPSRLAASVACINQG